MARIVSCRFLLFPLFFYDFVWGNCVYLYCIASNYSDVSGAQTYTHTERKSIERSYIGRHSFSWPFFSLGRRDLFRLDLLPGILRTATLFPT